MHGQTVVTARARRTFAALAYPNYRLWFFGQMASLFGTWMQSTAQGYLVYELTRSELYLGYVGFASGIATWLFTLYGGVIADRIPRRRLLVITQTLSMILAFVLSILVFTRVVAPWHIILLAFCLGVVNAFDAPARQSFVLEMVERPVLTNAIALNGTMFNTATAIGPAIGGVTYAAFGPGWCFAINGVSFLAVIAALVAMRLAPTQVRTVTGSALTDIREGLHAVLSNRRILAVICLVGAASLFTSASSTLMPAWAVQVLGGNALTNGALTSARGIGALLAALSIATLSHRLRKGRVMTAASMAFPIALVLFSFTRSLPLSLLALLYVGASNILVVNLANSLVQTMVPDSVRGRVMGIYMLSFFGFTTIGAMLAGSVAKSFGVPLTVALGGVCFFLCALVVSFLVPSLRKQA